MLSKLLDGFLLQSYYEHMNSCSYVQWENIFQGETNHRDIVRIKANCEQDLWYVAGTGYFKPELNYYMFGSFGYIFDPSDYSGILIELNDIKDEGWFFKSNMRR